MQCGCFPHARLCFVDRDFDPHDLASSLPRKKKAFAEQGFPQPGVDPSAMLSTNLVHSYSFDIPEWCNDDSYKNRHTKSIDYVFHFFRECL